MAHPSLYLSKYHIVGNQVLQLIYPSLVLVQPRKTRPCLTERLLMGRKESNQTKQKMVSASMLFWDFLYIFQFVNKLQDMTDDDEPLVQSILTK